MPTYEEIVHVALSLPPESRVKLLEDIQKSLTVKKSDTLIPISDLINHLKANPISFKGRKKLTREEIHDRHYK